MATDGDETREEGWGNNITPITTYNPWRNTQTIPLTITNCKYRDLSFM